MSVFIVVTNLPHSYKQAVWHGPQASVESGERKVAGDAIISFQRCILIKWDFSVAAVKVSKFMHWRA